MGDDDKSKNNNSTAVILLVLMLEYNTNAFPYRLDYKAEFRALYYVEVHSQCRWRVKSLTVNH